MRKIIFLALLILSLQSIGQELMVYDTINSKIPDNVIKTLTIDRSGNLWIVTGDCFYGGFLVKFDQKDFTVYDSTDGIPDKFITAVAFDTSGLMWLGTRYHGIASFDGRKWNYYDPATTNFPNEHVRSISVDSKNRIWACTDKGLAVFFNGKWDVMNTGNSALPDNAVNNVAFSRNSNAIWIATEKGLLWAYDYGAIKQMINPAPVVYNKSNSKLPDEMVNQVVVNDSNYLWVSSWGGILKIRDDNASVYTPENSKIPDFVEYIMTAYKNELWVATNNGLHILKNNEWHSYSPNNSKFPDFFVNRVVFDKDGNAWIATQSSGLVKFINQ